jgi:hypothetical protein
VQEERKKEGRNTDRERLREEYRKTEGNIQKEKQLEK